MAGLPDGFIGSIGTFFPMATGVDLSYGILNIGEPVPRPVGNRDERGAFMLT